MRRNLQKNHVVIKMALWAAIASFLLPNAVFAEYYSMLAPTSSTPSDYLMPKFDAFNYQNTTPPQLPEEEPDLPPVADFNIYTDQQGLQNNNMGTVDTVFTFDATASTDTENYGQNLEVRWYFENSTKPDTYFSTGKSIRHTFKNPGTYQVKLEVLDNGGNVSSKVKQVTVVENTPPIPFFRYSPSTGTEKTIFTFDTGKSRDDQFLSTYLEYRFDWNGDDKWDTKYLNNTTWSHIFNAAGTHHVIMEVKDPGDKTAQYSVDVVTTGNTPPTASFTIKSVSNGFSTGYEFDALKSSDSETSHEKLMFRWDFNYGGSNDIVYDTDWSPSDRFTGYFQTAGQHTVKLEVRDEDGAIATSLAVINVSWTDVMVNNAFWN